MSQNLVIPGKDNRVTLIFGGIVLADSTDIVMNFGGEVLSTTGTSPKLVIIPPTVDEPEALSCDLSGTAEVGKIFATVTYFDGASVNGTEITSREINNLGQIVIAVGSQLIIEDGTIVEFATSLATDDELKAWASIRNKDIPATQPDREALLILAMDYITSKESSLKGCRVSQDQALPYPRYGICANGFNLASDEIPVNAKQAQLELAILAKESGLFIDGQNKNVSKEKLGDLEVEYFSGGSWAQVQTGSADTYLKPLMINNGSNNIMMRV